VLDASALLAVLQREPGSESVAEALAAGAAISAVNLSEVIAKLSDIGMAERDVRTVLDALGLEVLGFDAELAYAAGLLRPATKQMGLSLGDRACLALAQHLGLEALTADRSWSELRLDVSVRVVR